MIEPLRPRCSMESLMFLGQKYFFMCKIFQVEIANPGSQTLEFSAACEHMSLSSRSEAKQKPA
jgi:hypothetical protein